MGDISHVVGMWAEEGIIIVALLASVLLFHYATKVWGAPIDVALGVLLGICVGVALAGLYLTRHIWQVMIGTKVFWFVALYLWCVAVMLFFAARSTNKFKLLLGLVAQGGIVYTLFVLL